MTNAVAKSAPEHSSELYEVRQRPPVTSFIYFFVDREYEYVKIGFTKDVAQRLGQYRTGNPFIEIHAVIEGDKNHEAQLHRIFGEYAIAEAGQRENFYIKGRLANYLDYLSDKSWAASSIDEIKLIYPAPSRFPWDARIEPIGQMDLFHAKPNVRKPKPFSEKVEGTLRSDSDEWATPPIYIEAARRVMGSIDLDPASNPLAQQIVKAGEILTKNEDGLRYRWRGNIWLNPPFGGVSGEFVSHLIREYEAGHVKQAVVCVNNHSTDSIWYQPLKQFPCCIPHHRPNFVGGARDSGGTDTSPNKGISFTYIGSNQHLFIKEFSVFGAIQGQLSPARTSPEVFRRQLIKLSWNKERFDEQLRRIEGMA